MPRLEDVMMPNEAISGTALLDIVQIINPSDRCQNSFLSPFLLIAFAFPSGLVPTDPAATVMTLTIEK